LHKETAIGLGKILNTEFDETVVRDSDVLHEPLDNPVLAPLREDLKFSVSQSAESRGFRHRVGSKLSLQEESTLGGIGLNAGDRFTLNTEPLEFATGFVQRSLCNLKPLDFGTHLIMFDQKPPHSLRGKMRQDALPAHLNRSLAKRIRSCDRVLEFPLTYLLH
jgi:hypothetical protein